MGHDLTTSGGGLHPGRPVIWPSGKKSSSSTSSSSSAKAKAKPTPTQAKTAQSAQQSQQSQASQQAQKVAQAMKEAVQAQTQNKQQVAKEFSVQDLKQHLLSQQIQTNDFNVKLATMMLRYGMEVSKSNFAKLSNMLAGTDKSITSQEASILLLMKGVDSPEAAKNLATFLKENPQLASQLKNVSSNVADLQAALNMAKGTLPTEVMQALSALLAQFDDNISNLHKKYKFSGNNSSGRGELVNDMRALKAVLAGVQNGQSLPDTAEGQILQSNMQGTMESVDKVIENLTSQSYLSKHSNRADVDYAYYQVPNSMASTPQTSEIIIKRSGKDGNKIDPKDTQIIMSLNTDSMGKVAICMTVKNKKIDFIFNTQKPETKDLIVKESGILTSGLSDNDFVATKLQVNVNPSMSAVRPYLIPFLGIEDLMRIDLSV